jgi:phosphoribosylformylglycinamidine synthase
MRARVFVTLKPSVFDPQGRTIVEAAVAGYPDVADVRQGKYLSSISRPPSAQTEMAGRRGRRQGAANPVIESYRIEVD